MKPLLNLERLHVHKDTRGYDVSGGSIVMRRRTSLANRRKDSIKLAEQSARSLVNSTGVVNLFGASSENQASSMSEATLDQIMPNFVSKQVRRIAHQKCSMMPVTEDGNPAALPEMEKSVSEAFAAVVMVDVSGYSKLTAALAERGPQGTELLAKTMKDYLDKIINTIVSFGGDIVKFAGDAVIFCWKNDRAVDLSDTSMDSLRGELVYKASQCCLELLMSYGTYNIDIEDCPTKELRIHLGIGAGKIFDVMVGGKPGRWEHFIAGEAINQLSTVLDLAKAGELALSHLALKWLKTVVDFNNVDLGGYDKRCIILKGLEKAKRIADAPTEAVDDDIPFIDLRQLEAVVDLYKYFVDRTAMFKLQADINQCKLFQMNSGLMDLLNLTELRQVTTIFIKIGSLRAVNGEELLDASQEAISIVQQALSRCEGSLRQFHVDDKGAVILCFFGLPPLAHENDAFLGLNAGIEIRDKFVESFDEFSIGITTGVVSYGGVGTEGRAEYAVVGDSINMAARLMCHKEAESGILCDEKTYNLCDGNYIFENLGETKVKGKNTPISIYRPTTIVGDLNKKKKEKQSLYKSIIGREKEKAAILESLNLLSQVDPTGPLIICGDGGQGLSTMAQFTKVEAIQRNINVCVGTATEMEKSEPYNSFRGLLNDIISLIEHMTDLPYSSRLPLVMEGAEQSSQLNIVASSDERNSVSSNLISPRSPEFVLTDIKSPTSVISTSMKESKSKMKALDDDFDFEDNKGDKKRVRARTLSTIATDGGVKKQEHIEFHIKARRALEMIGEDPADVELLNIVIPSDYDEENNDLDGSKTNLRHRTKELVDLLSRIIHGLLSRQKLAFIITEAQWMDHMSWELLLELQSFCPQIGIVLFSRPEGSYETRENKAFLKRLQHLPQAKTKYVEGLSLDETNRMLLATWTGQPITSVAPKIVESIYKRTDGNPFFIRSLAIAMKDSGQWRVMDGCLSGRNGGDVDFEKLVLGYDNQNIILAQYDRLDRNFQLFLKVAAVLGQKFLVDDVLYFLTGMVGLYEKMDTKNYTIIIKNIQATDKYSFLARDAKSQEGVYLHFKSAVVRKCIYDNMVKSQRSQLHLNVAIYYESRMTENNRHRFLIPIFEHYREASDTYIAKKIYYTEAVAGYYYQKNSMVDAIQHYKSLIRMVENVDAVDEFDSLRIANWYRELGHALFIREELDDSEAYLLVSLELLDITIPANGFRLKWRLRQETRTRRKRDARYLQSLAKSSSEKVDYLTSYRSARSHSSFSLSLGQLKKNDQASINTEKADAFDSSGGNSSVPYTRYSVNTNGSKPGGSTGQESSSQELISPTFQILRHVLITLAEVYQRKGDAIRQEYTILLGLNIGEGNPPDLMLSRFFGMGATVIWLREAESVISQKYMDVADRLDSRQDIFTSIQIAENQAHLSFLKGKWDTSISQNDILLHLSSLAGDIQAKVRGLSLRISIYLVGISRSVASHTSQELCSLSVQKDSWVGQFWGTFGYLYCLPGPTTKHDEIIQAQASFVTIWSSAPPAYHSNALYKLSQLGLMAWSDIQLSRRIDIFEYFLPVEQLITKLGTYQWEVFFGLIPLALSLATAVHKGWASSSAEKKLVSTSAAKINQKLKQMKGLCLSNPLRRIYKGIYALNRNDPNQASKAWKKGLDSNSPGIYLQGILHLFIGKLGPSSAKDAQAHLAQGTSKLKELGALREFEVIWGKFD